MPETKNVYRDGLGKWAVLALFVTVVVGIGFAIGFSTRPGAWYAGLAKPAFNPPNWVFAPVWTVVYTLIAIAGWRVWLAHGRRSVPARVWLVQMVLNWLWSPVFFGLQQIGWALLIISALLLTIVVFLASVRDRIAFWAFVPYALWVGFATALNAAIAFLN